MSHDHDHDHDHEPHHPRPLSAPEARTRALEALLVGKGVISTDAIDAVIETYEHDVGPQNGARVVAKAWVDQAFRQRLLADGTAAIAELGFGGAEADLLVVVQNEPGVHNMVVCTLCSCYPWAVLGLPPTWYKDADYRRRAVSEPRAVLSEFGVQLDEATEIRVWDSSAECRYLVLPERPAGTEGWPEEQLATLVNRNAMIGTGLVEVLGS